MAKTQKAEAQAAKNGDTVRVHYRGSLEDGTEFDSSEGGEPLEVTIGEQQVIRGFEEAIIGMRVGDLKREVIPADRAYGEHREDLVFNVKREQIPSNEGIEIGDTLRIAFSDGETAAVEVSDMDAKSLTLDANHTLAGLTLVFDLQLVSIE